MKRPNLLLFVALLFLASISNSFSFAQNKLYFCEQYKDGEEIGVSDKFTTGWLTVMVDLRPSFEVINADKVELKIIKIKDSIGNYVDETIDIVPFDVDPDWDYIYFTDYDRVAFNSEGLYEVVCQRKDGSFIASGIIEIIPDEN
jgi:hypothetical protein